MKRFMQWEDLAIRCSHNYVYIQVIYKIYSGELLEQDPQVVPNLVRVILAEVVSELVATGELLLAHGAPERSLHHILRSIALKGQWPKIFSFFLNNKFS